MAQNVDLQRGLVIVDRHGCAHVLDRRTDDGLGWWLKPGDDIYISDDEITSRYWLLLDRDRLRRLWETER